jgi:predicted nucleic acid-binding protein
LELALAAKVYLLISGDSDLLDMSPWRGVRIVQAQDYLALTDPV